MLRRFYMAAAFCLISAPVLAQNGPNAFATIQAEAAPDLQKPTTLAVQASQSNEVNDRLVPFIQKVLIRQGYTVDPNSTMTLSFDANANDGIGNATTDQPGEDVVFGDPTPPSDNGFDPESDPSNTGYYPEEYEQAPTAVVIFSSDLPVKVPGQLYELNFFLDDGGGVPLWQGTATVTLPAQDAYLVARAMSGPLASTIGKTISNQRYPIH